MSNPLLRRGLGGARRPATEAEMDMTPMVDVTFLLLIFFMVTAAFSPQKSLDLPAQDPSQASSRPRTLEDYLNDPDYVVVRIDPYNTFHVITADWEREAPGEQDLRVQLREARTGRSGPPPTRLLVLSHGDAWHGKVVAAIDAGAAEGLAKVQWITSDEE